MSRWAEVSTPLGDDGDAEVVGKRGDTADDGAAFAFLGQRRHEGTVNLQEVDREILEMTQRGIASAEVVEGDLDALVGQLRQSRLHLVGYLGQQDVLRYLDHQRRRRHAELVERGGEAIAEVAAPELGRGNVDRHVIEDDAARTPVGRLTQPPRG